MPRPSMESTKPAAAAAAAAAAARDDKPERAAGHVVAAGKDSADEVVDPSKKAKALNNEALPEETSPVAKAAATAPTAAEAKAKKPQKKRVRRVGTTAPRKELKSEEETLAYKVQSKHDEKWNYMFDKLVAYKQKHHSTLVPQLYHPNPKLGRWVHYQRVEYWTLQSGSSDKAKITPDRILRLNDIGFEWDPQRAQWNIMFDKLRQFHEAHGHCKVPKGYVADPELANWVRNQRLEQANRLRNKKSRMTDERFDKLSKLGFVWSNPLPAKKERAQQVEVKIAEATAAAEAAEKDQRTKAKPRSQEV